MDDGDFRSLALALPEVTEQDHHGFPSWRLRGKVLATLPEPGAVNVMAAEGVIREAVAEYPGWCHERWWGSRLAAVTVRLVDAKKSWIRLSKVIDTTSAIKPSCLMMSTTVRRLRALRRHRGVTGLLVVASSGRV